MIIIILDLSDFFSFLAPSGPPVDVVATINSSSSIAVSWSAPVGGANGYVILYSGEGGNNMTQLVEGEGQTSSVLTGLSKGQLYTISVFAYKDLPSLLSDPVNVLHDGEMLRPLTSSPHPPLSSLSSWSSVWCQCYSSLPNQCVSCLLYTSPSPRD